MDKYDLSILSYLKTFLDFLMQIKFQAIFKALFIRVDFSDFGFGSLKFSHNQV